MENDFFRGEWHEFRKWEEREHNGIREDLKDIKEKVDSLRLWKATMLGASSVIGALAGWLAGNLKF